MFLDNYLDKFKNRNNFLDLKRILYITYDGLLDPLGQNQILPYILGLNKNGYKFIILSFEKNDKNILKIINLKK